MQGKAAYIRPKVVEPSPTPHASGSYVHHPCFMKGSPGVAVKLLPCDPSWVQVLKTTSCKNAGKGCVHKTQSGQTLPQTLHKQEAAKVNDSMKVNRRPVYPHTTNFDILLDRSLILVHEKLINFHCQLNEVFSSTNTQESCTSLY
jgi:hypothetical protein